MEEPTESKALSGGFGPPYDAFGEYLPPYLTRENKIALVQALSEFPNNKHYYQADKYEQSILQGDCWTHLKIVQFLTGEQRNVTGIILSNTCDIDPGNPRDLPTRIVFAPIIRLEEYEALLRRYKIDEEKIRNKLKSVRDQGITTIFYLPDSIGGPGSEYIALLDDIHTMPSEVFFGDEQRAKRCSLSDHGFYLFMVKLSIHFCRLREGLLR